MKKPINGINSPWPALSIALFINGFKGMNSSNKPAQGVGILPVATTKNITAITSCITSIPMASLPWRVRISPCSSINLTTQTVLLKLRANTINAEVVKLKPLIKGIVINAIPFMMTTPTTNQTAVWLILPNQTSALSKSFILSFKPMVNNISVIPMSANTWIMLSAS